MAQAYPDKPLVGTRSNAERKVFYALKDLLSNDYTLFHSIPIYRMKDKTDGLVDGEVDFIIAHPKKGLIVIEVKGGGIALNSSTNKWSTTDSKGNIHEIKDPFEQAKEYKYCLLDDLRTCPLTKRYSYPIGHAVWFPDIDLRFHKIGISIHLDKLVLDANSLSDVSIIIQRLFNELLGSEGRKSPEITGISALVKYLAPSWEILPTLHTHLINEDRKILEVTKSQYRVITLLEKVSRALISGCAGSGKTLLALEKARRLADCGKRVLIVCFNKNLALWMKTHMSMFNNVDVFNFHCLCTYFARAAEIPISSPAPESGDAYFLYELPEILVDALTQTDERYDALIVDEGQDFLPLWWIPLQILLKDPDEDIFYIFFDNNQTIYNKELKFPFSGPIVSLTENCRNTKTIHNQVMRFYKGDVKPQAIGPDGRKPQYIISDNKEVSQDIRNILRKLINEEGLSPHDIVILTPLGSERSQLKEGYKVGHIELTWKEPKLQQVKCSTIHGFKGLESRVVILTELDNIPISNHDELYYIGMSRARNHLIIITAEEDCAISNINPT